MCPIDVYYEVEDPRFNGKKLLKTLQPSDEGLGLTCAHTGETKVVVCDPDDTGGTIMRRDPQDKSSLSILSIGTDRLPTIHMNTQDLTLDDTIPRNGTQTFRMRNQAGNSCLITCTHRSPR